MHVSEVRYERLISEGYNNRRVGVTVQLGPDEDRHVALKAAESFVNRALHAPSPDDTEKLKGVAEQLHESAEQLHKAAEALSTPDIPF